MIELKEITKVNIDEVLNLKIADNQQNYISSVAYSLAQAWAYKDTAYPFAVYANNTAVGFIMLGYYQIKNQYTLWKFLIDEKYQNRGYGRIALKLAIDWLKKAFHVEEIYTGVAFNNVVAENLYHSLGFRRTGVQDESQIEMRLIIEKEQE